MTDDESFEAWIAEQKAERERLHAQRVERRRKIMTSAKESRRVRKTYSNAWRGKHR